LFAGIVANLCQGAAYASSVFAKPLLEYLNCTIMTHGKLAPDMHKWAFAFSLSLAMLPIGMLLSGKMADQRSPRTVVLIGAILFGGGMFLAGFTHSITWFYLTFGVMMGLGSGSAYGAIVSASVRWFPDRRGLASGLAVGALGFGPVVIAPVAEKLMSTAPAGAVPVLFAFKVLGAAFLIAMGFAAIATTNPPKAYKPAGYTPSPAAKAASGISLTWTQMLGSGKFWGLYLLYACGAFSGLMIISQAKPMAMEIKANPDALKLFALQVVMIIAIANASGRVVWGFISDLIGRMPSLCTMFLVTAVAMFLLPRFAGQEGTFMADTILIGICFGGYLGTFPSLCADSFGSAGMTVNYALLFSAFAVAALAGPYVGANIKDHSGSYNNAYIIAGIVSAIGFIAALAMTLAESNEKKASASLNPELQKQQV
jgi:OFA family oxalate/formate antiporter-like MFS transporter